MYDAELEKEKDVLKARKQKLREIQDRDIQLKQRAVVARDAMYNSTDDFKDKNIMSYCFDSKENKSFIMGKRND